MSSSDLLDDLDDIKDEVRQFEKGLYWATFVIVLSATMMVGGQVVIGVIPILRNAGIATTVVGVIGLAMSLLFGVVWMCTRGYPEKRANLYQKRREAQRAYDRASRREGERAMKEQSW